MRVGEGDTGRKADRGTGRGNSECDFMIAFKSVYAL